MLSDRPGPDRRIRGGEGGVGVVRSGEYEEGRILVNTQWHALQLMREAKGSASNYTEIMAIS